MRRFPLHDLIHAAAAAGLLLAAPVARTAPLPQASPPTAPPPVRELAVTDHHGGTHHRIAVRDDTWYQTFSNSLLVIDARTGHLVNTVELAPFGTTGPATDLALAADRMWVVLDRTGVVELSLAEPRQPALVSRRDADELGVTPRRVSVVDNRLFVSGRGGVVTWDDRRRYLQDRPFCGAVVPSAKGLVTTVGREVQRLEDGTFLGLAMELARVPDGADIGAPLLFALQSENGVRVGTMAADLSEIDSTAVPGIGRSLRFAAGRLWVVTDTEIWSFALADGTLGTGASFRVRGARDVAPVGPNTLAVSGSFGRALYRVLPVDDLPGDTFFRAHREPSRLSRAVADSRRILAGSDEGNWMYLIGADAELSDRTLDATMVPPRSATLPWGTARIADDGRSVRLGTGSDERTFVPEGEPVIGCVAAIDGDLWIGHELGLEVVAPDADGVPKRVDRLRMEGLVLWIFPKWDGGCAYVSEFGGIGTAELRERPMTEAELAAWLAEQEARARRLAEEAKRRKERP